jgi:hypothetical protein
MDVVVAVVFVAVVVVVIDFVVVRAYVFDIQHQSTKKQRKFFKDYAKKFIYIIPATYIVNLEAVLANN